MKKTIINSRLEESKSPLLPFQKKSQKFKDIKNDLKLWRNIFLRAGSHDVKRKAMYQKILYVKETY